MRILFFLLGHLNELHGVFFSYEKRILSFLEIRSLRPDHGLCGRELLRNVKVREHCAMHYQLWTAVSDANWACLFQGFSRICGRFCFPMGSPMYRNIWAHLVTCPSWHFERPAHQRDANLEDFGRTRLLVLFSREMYTICNPFWSKDVQYGFFACDFVWSI